MTMIWKKVAALLLVVLVLVGIAAFGFAEEETIPAEEEADMMLITDDEDTAAVPQTDDNSPDEGVKTVYRAFELALQQGGQDLPEGKLYKVTVQAGIDESTMIPEGAVRTRAEYKLFRIQGQEMEEIEDAVLQEDGSLVFTTEAFGSFSLEYTVFFRSESEPQEVIEEEPVILEAEGVTIEVLSGDVPADANVVITMLDENAVELLLQNLPLPQDS